MAFHAHLGALIRSHQVREVIAQGGLQLALTLCEVDVHG
ncbi:hypothetical protein AS9A_0906 [Hoyosella subflava DQS3-9A1]|uniref:Uncharacterized protein n=1 Tax=Hoyosella subflava (strain DSM 45089 / JCM 17490 / NBRC 109087 / DQS3-9A1) TaxID=443218 RepID=F6EN41_HOYSD|nr:hypothetical protein AS9A_0906 [Hoyosella subflava DQS3-9A1]